MTAGWAQSTEGSVSGNKEFTLGGMGSSWGNVSRKTHYDLF